MLMKAIYQISILMFCFAITANAQNIKIRQDNPQAAAEELDLAAYDGKSPSLDLQLLKQHPNYYNGCKIVFLPNVERPYDYIEGFYVEEEVEQPSLADTTWNRSKTKIKKIAIPSTNVYKPQRVNKLFVKVFDSGDGVHSGKLELKSGFFTSADSIERWTFTIKGSFSKEVERTLTTFTEFDIYLLDEQGTNVIWHLAEWLPAKSKMFLPVVVYDYLSDFEQQVGKTFVYTRKNIYKQHSLVQLYFGDDYKCTDFSFARGDYYPEGLELGHYYMPALFFDHNGEEIRYDIIPRGSTTLVGDETSITRDEYDAMLEKEVYLAQLQAEENARIQKEQEVLAEYARKEQERQQRLAEQRAQEEKERAAAAARAQKAREKEQAEAAERRAAKYAQLIATYGASTAELIMQGKVRIGWTSQMCRESWGAPRKINRTITAYGVDEQWVYYKGFLYFTDGILRTIQD